ncbi:MAG: hypothetical protein QM658_03380 [Gordonia sp. (in: high G+C Gram-positive bacteria)]
MTRTITDESAAERLVFDRPRLDPVGPRPSTLAQQIPYERAQAEREVRAAWNPEMGQAVLDLALGWVRGESAHECASYAGRALAEVGTVDPDKVYVPLDSTHRHALARARREATAEAKRQARELLAAPVDELAADHFMAGYSDDEHSPSPALTAEVRRLLGLEPKP